MIDCVTIATNQFFPGNLVAEQHRLRYREVVAKENWRDIYVVDGMEFYPYDNLATEYFIARDARGRVVGVTRSYPTTIPYMLADVFTYLTNAKLPSSPRIFEASRLFLDRTLLSREDRRPVIDRLAVACMERALQRNIDAYVGFMLPKIWASTFQRIGWEPQWLGPPRPLPGTNEVVRAGLLPVSEKVDRRIREQTGLHENLLNFGAAGAPRISEAATYSDLHVEKSYAA